MTTGFESAITGAGFAPDDQLGLGNAFGLGGGSLETNVGDPVELLWADVRKSPIYEQLGIATIPNADNINFSDNVIDWDKWGVNYDVPFGYNNLSSIFSNITDTVAGTPSSAWGANRFRVQDGNIQKRIKFPTAEEQSAIDAYNADVARRAGLDDSLLSAIASMSYGAPLQKPSYDDSGDWVTVDRWGEYDRDPSDYMGWMDPRLSLIMADAEGWNDPVSNWLQSLGEEPAADLIGALNYRARNGDSSHMFFRDSPEAYWISRFGEDAPEVLRGADPEQLKQIQGQWSSGMTPGAQSARHDAMFGDSLFGDFGGLLGTVLSFIPGLQPIGIGLSALNAIDQGNPLGLLSAGLGLANLGALGDLTTSPLGSVGEMAAADFADFGLEGLSKLNEGLQYAGGPSLWSSIGSSPLGQIGKAGFSTARKVGARDTLLNRLTEGGDRNDSDRYDVEGRMTLPVWAGRGNVFGGA